MKTLEQSIDNMGGSDWTIRWHPNPANAQGPADWLDKSYHGSVEEAEAELKRLLASQGMDSDPGHWMIVGPVNTRQWK